MISMTYYQYCPWQPLIGQHVLHVHSFPITDLRKNLIVKIRMEIRPCTMASKIWVYLVPVVQYACFCCVAANCSSYIVTVIIFMVLINKKWFHPLPEASMNMSALMGFSMLQCSNWCMEFYNIELKAMQLFTLYGFIEKYNSTMIG